MKPGEHLSPILFIMFVNDMQEKITENVNPNKIFNEISIFLLMYSYGTILFSNAEDELHELLDNSNCYCEKWKIEVNTETIKICVFQKQRSNCDFIFKYKNSVLDIFKITYELKQKLQELDVIC